MKRDLIACLPLAIAAALGAWLAFPIFDDGYYLLLLREGGPRAFAPAHLDRPLYGWLLSLAARGLGESAGGLALVSGAVWLWLALATGWLWRTCFPQVPQWSALAAAGVLAPAWVEAQLSTVTLMLPTVLPVALTLTGALLLVRERRVFGLVCLGLGALVSEYGFCAALALAPSLYPRLDMHRRIWAAATVLACFGLFLATRQTQGVREDVTVEHAATSLRDAPAEAPLRLMRGLGRLLAPLHALELVGPSSERPRAALAGWAFAGLTAMAFWSACAPFGDCRPEEGGLWLILTGWVLALAPVVAFGRDPAAGGFGSRFLLPALPVAALLPPALLGRFLVPAARRPLAAVVGLGFGLSAFQAALSASDHARAMDALGRRLAEQPPQAGFVVALVDSGGGARWAPGSPYMMTAQAERALPADQRGRLWLLDATTADGCPTALDWRGRGITRKGPVQACFRAQVAPNGSVQFERLPGESEPSVVIP